MNALHRMQVVIAALLSAGCAVGPDYQPPVLAEDAGWVDAQSVSIAPVPAEWWRRFDDVVLTELVESAIAGNLDIAAAAERIREARARTRGAGARRYPSLDAGASVRRQRQSETGPLPVGRIPGLATYQTVYDAGLDASWEADLFGANRRRLEASDARLSASIEDQHAVRISVTGEVARSYFELRGAQAELGAQQAAVAAARDVLRLTTIRFEAGEAARAEVKQAEVRLKTLAAGEPAIVARRDRAAMRLALLLGEPPESRLELVTAPAPVPALRDPPVGERADILRRRPDIRAAERRLAAATADIGVATAALYPQLMFSADGGYQSLDATDLSESASRSWSIAPIISWRVFDGGRIRAEIAAAESRARRAAIAYEQAVLAALSEAEQSMAAYRASLETLALQRDALEAARATRELIETRYRAGEVSLLELLDIQETVALADVAVSRAKATAAIDMVTLYKNLGGGWNSAVGQPVARSIPD